MQHFRRARAANQLQVPEWGKSPTKTLPQGHQLIDNKYRFFGSQAAFKTRFEVSIVFRFDQLIRRDMIVRDVKQRYPQTVPVFEQLHFRAACDDCDIETGARKNGLKVLDVVEALNQAAFGPTENESHADYQ